MKLSPVIALVGIAVAAPCSAQLLGVGPVLSDAQIRAMVDQMLPNLELVEQYQKQLNEFAKCQWACQTPLTEADKETHRDPQATGDH
jgi:hypothetical protein